jgi:hypothetical protein
MRVFPVRKASRALKVQLALSVPLVRKASKDYKVSLVQQVRKALKVLSVRKVQYQKRRKTERFTAVKMRHGLKCFTVKEVAAQHVLPFPIRCRKYRHTVISGGSPRLVLCSSSMTMVLLHNG